MYAGVLGFNHHFSQFGGAASSANLSRFQEGHDDSRNKTSLVAWDLAWKPKTKGGLAIRQVGAGNNAYPGRYVWYISRKAYNLQVKWVNDVHPKGVNWWEYKALSTASGKNCQGERYPENWF